MPRWTRALTVLLLAAALLAVGTTSAAATSAKTDAQRALAVYRAMQRQFYVSHHYLDGNSYSPGTSAAWPYGQMLEAVVALGRIPSIGGPYRWILRRRLSQLDAYWNRSTTPAAYDSYPIRPRGQGGDQYYDDNAWFGIALMDGFDLLHDQRYLARAKQVFAFLAFGWDKNPRHACPGGVFWTRTRGVTSRNSVSTANTALVALRLYGATHEPSYLAWGVRMWSWVNLCLTRSDGLIADSISLTGGIDRRAFTYNQGAMVATGALLHQATGEDVYLEHAETLARAAVPYFTANRYAGEPRTFVAILFRDLFLLRRVDPSADYFEAAEKYADEAWTQGRDSRTNLFSAALSQDALLDQAGMVELYALLAAEGG